MSNRVQPGGRIDPEIKQDFKQYVEETTGGNQGDYSRLLERALVEYMDNDRGARIESKVDDVLDKLDEFADTPTPRSEESLERERQSATSSNPPIDSFNTRTEQAVQAISADMPNESSITESMVETAIEDNAGASYKTVKKYKRLLRKHGHAIPSPITGEDKWYTSVTPLALTCENNDKVTPHDIDELIGEYQDTMGEQWYLEALPDNFITNKDLKYDRHPNLDSSAYISEHDLEADTKTFQ
jgi:hypothetical protein